MTRRTRQVKNKAPDNLPKEETTLSILKTICGNSDVETMESALKPVRYVPTIFTSFNRAIVVGGAPVRATWLIHGPTGGGKTAFAIGIANSFVRNGHAAAYIDAEHSLTKKWALQLKSQMSGVMFKQPDTMEDAIDLVDGWIYNFRDAKKKGDIAEDRAFCIILDTIHKLVPAKELTQLKNKAKENLDKGWGRYRANMIATWVDHLTPLVGKSDVAFIALAHERENNKPNQSWYAPDYVIKGGQTLMYEAMVRVRIAQSTGINEMINGEKTLVGRAHTVLVAKNKVGYPHDKGTFYIGNGKGSLPLGFDHERELLMEMKHRNMLEGSTWITLPNGEKFQGDQKAINYLRDNPDVYTEFYNSMLYTDFSDENSD